MRKIKLPLLMILIIILLFTPDANIIQAYNHNPNTVFDNSFEHNGETVLPFILNNSEQTITKQYIEEQCKKAGHTFENKDALEDVIKTGDKIVTDDKTYTVLLYGDIDKNGKINVFDAQLALRHYVYEDIYEDCALTGIYAIVANVNNSTDVIDTFDAQRILQFWVGSETKLLLNEPLSSLELPNVPPVLAEVKVPYGTLLKDIELQEGWKFDNITSTLTVGDAGTKEFAITYTPSDKNGKVIHDKLTIIVEKAVPQNVPDLPTGLTAKAGDLLSVLEKQLPKGWKFDNVTKETTVGDIGIREFAVIYTPEDSKNYQTVSSTIIIAVTEETEKLVNLVQIGETTSVYRYDNDYYKNKVATIESSNNIPLTSDCKVELKVEGPTKLCVPIGNFSTVDGEYDIYLYATESGEYTITPIVSGKNVKNGKVIGEPIKVTVLENYELTDVAVDGILLTENIEENTEIIDAKIGKIRRPEIKFYHIYKDEKGKELDRVLLPDEELLDIHVTFVQQQSTNIKPINICNDKTPISWDEGTKTNSSIPNNILLEGKSIGTENVEISIHKIEENIKFSRTMKVKVSILQTIDLVVDTSIDLYSYTPVYKTTTVNGKNYNYLDVKEDNKEYTVVQGTLADGTTPCNYTIVPIKLLDEYVDDFKIDNGNIKTGTTWKDAKGYVTFIANNIEVKNFYLEKDKDGKKRYVEESCLDPEKVQPTKIEAVGIALKDTAINVSSIKVYYDNMEKRATKDISTTVIKEKIEGIILEEQSNTEIYRYDNNYKENKIATLTASNNIPLTEDFKIELKLEGPTDSEGSKVEGKISETGQYEIYLYATKAGKYTITPSISGTDVKNGKITGEPIEVTVEENYSVTDIELDGKLLSENTDENDIIELKVGKNIIKDITFYHIYRDKSGKELARVSLPDEELLRICITFPEKIVEIKDPNIYNGETPVNWDETTKSNDYVPDKILLGGQLATTNNKNMVINVQNSSKYNNSIVLRTIKVKVLRLQTKDLVVDTSIDLYANTPEYTSATVNGKAYNYLDVAKDGKTYTVVQGTLADGTPCNYTIVPIKLLDEDGADFKIDKGNIKTEATEKTWYRLKGYVTFVASNIEVKNFYLEKVKVKDGDKDVEISYYVEESYLDPEKVQPTKIEAVGIALKDTTMNVSTIKIYYDNMQERAHKDLQVSRILETTPEITNDPISEEENNIDNTLVDNSITEKTPNKAINANTITTNSINSKNTTTSNTINKNTITTNTMQHTLNSNTINKNAIGNTIN